MFNNVLTSIAYHNTMLCILFKQVWFILSLQHLQTTMILSFLCGHVYIEWNLSNTRTPLGPQEVRILIRGRGVLISAVVCTHLYAAGTMDSVLKRCMSVFRRSLTERFHWYHIEGIIAIRCRWWLACKAISGLSLLPSCVSYKTLCICQIDKLSTKSITMVVCPNKLNSHVTMNTMGLSSPGW